MNIMPKVYNTHGLEMQNLPRSRTTTILKIATKIVYTVRFSRNSHIGCFYVCMYLFIYLFSIFKLFYCCSITVVCIFSPPQPNPPPSPASTLPLGFVHVSFIVVPENPSHQLIFLFLFIIE